MNRKVSFHELAELELSDAAFFFEMEGKGLGLRFLTAVETAVAHIQDYPEASPIIIRNVRCKLLLRFPYSIMYSIKPHRIRILAIANQRRRPFYWRSRT